MNKIILITILSTFLLVNSCSSQKNNGISSNDELSGTWNLTNNNLMNLQYNARAQFFIKKKGKKLFLKFIENEKYRKVEVESYSEYLIIDNSFKYDKKAKKIKQEIPIYNEKNEPTGKFMKLTYSKSN